MELTRKILHLALAASILILSCSVFIYSIRDSKAIAMPQKTADGYVPVGWITKEYGRKIHIAVLGFNPESGDMKVLARRQPELLD